MAEEGFKLPASSYEELTKIIMGYGKSKEPIAPGAISRLTGQNEDQISKNNPFLVSIGVVKGGKKKVATELGFGLARALEHDMPDEIVKNWRDVVLANDFLQKILSAIKIRKGMDAPTLQAHVAYSAGQPKTPRVLTGAKTVTDILRAAGLIAEDDGKFTVGSTGVATTEPVDIRVADAMQVTHKGLPGLQQPTFIDKRIPEAGMGISIQIQIQCTASEVEGLGVKLKQLIRDLSFSDALGETDSNFALVSSDSSEQEELRAPDTEANDSRTSAEYSSPNHSLLTESGD